MFFFYFTKNSSFKIHSFHINWIYDIGYLHIQWDEGHFGQVSKHHVVIPGTVRHRSEGWQLTCFVFSFTTFSALLAPLLSLDFISSLKSTLFFSSEISLSELSDSSVDSSEESLWIILTCLRILTSAQLMNCSWGPNPMPHPLLSQPQLLPEW